MNRYVKIKLFSVCCFIQIFLCNNALAATYRRSTVSKDSSSSFDAFHWFICIMIFLFCACVIGEIVRLCSTQKNGKGALWLNGNRMSEAEREFAEEAHRISSKGIDAKTSKKAKEALLEYEAAHAWAESNTRLVSEEIYQEDIRDIRDNYETLAREEWEKKADKILNKFIELFHVMNDPEFSDIERAYKSKKRCIEYWQKYFTIPFPDGVIIHPKEYMRYILDKEYEPCMESHEALEKRLTQCVEQMKPEYKRAVKLRNDMLDTVWKNESMMRSDLLRMTFDGCTAKEVEYCYRELIKKYKLVEVKLSNRYIVKLSDKEAEKRISLSKKQSQNQNLHE